MKRRWPYRLAQVSPFIVLALIASGWLVVPTGARMMSAQQLSLPRIGQADPLVYRTPGAELEAMRAIYHEKNPDVGLYDEDVSALRAKAYTIADALEGESARLFDAKGEPIPGALSASDPVFDALRVHEKETGGQVSAYLLPANPMPPVVLSGIGDITVLTDAEQRELETSGTIGLLRQDAETGAIDYGTLDFSQRGSISGGQVSDRYFTYGLSMIDGHLYEAYAVCRPERSMTLDTPVMYSWTQLDTSANRKALEKTARRAQGCVFIVGPIDAEPVLIWESQGARHEELLPLVQPRLDDILTSTAPFVLSSKMSRAAGGARWGNVALAGREYAHGEDTTSFAVLVIGSYDTHPGVPILWKALGDTPLKRVQVFFAAHFATIEGALGALMLVSLVAAPIAFVSERRRFERIDTERERERVQREARLRVVDRLTRLSDDMDRSAATAAGKVRREVADVSDDIQATVTELKSILGEASSSNVDRHE